MILGSKVIFAIIQSTRFLAGLSQDSKKDFEHFMVSLTTYIYIIRGNNF